MARAETSFELSYIVEFTEGEPSTFVIESASDPFPQPARIREVDLEIGSLSPGDSAYIYETVDEAESIIDEFVYLGTVTIGGKVGVLARIVNDPDEPADDDYYLYMESALSPEEESGTKTLVENDFLFCLLSGTNIETTRGIVNVEDLIPGDLVLDSQGSYSPVRWVGVQTVSPLFSGKASWPVKISKGALGENTPNEDLYVSQDHAIFLQGLLVCAEALVNGSTITIEEPKDASIKYYGIDLGPATIHPVHNLPVGSLGAVPREYFDNYQEWLDSGYELIDEPLMFPRVKSASQLPKQIRRSISA
jgi:hypothetical protein